MNNDVDVSGSKYDVDDITKYEYLNPVWSVLENTPEKGITSKELWDQTELDPVKGNKLMQELANEFMQKVLHNFVGLFVDKKQIVNSWAFDKVMLLTTRIETGSGVMLPDNMVFNMWKREWRKKRGM
jgi:hypothetical protein